MIYQGVAREWGAGGQRWGVDIALAHSESDGPIAFGEHEFDRANIRFQYSNARSQTDLIAAYQGKRFGWPNLYTPFNSNETENHPADSFEHMVRRAQERNFPFPYLRDESQDVARAYGALRTPHYFLFVRSGENRDGPGSLRYTGRMDDNPRTPGAETTRELIDATEAVLAGRKPPVEVTNPIGCNIKWKGKPEKWMPPEACDLV